MVRSSSSVIRQQIARATSEVLEARRLFSAGAFDATYNSTGRQLIGFGVQQDQGNAIALESDGSVVVAGSTVDTNGQTNVALSRLRPDGTPDANFGAKQTLLNGDPAKATAVTTLADGSILVAGVVSVTSTNNDGFVAKFTPKGVLDTSFGTGGVVTNDYGGNDDTVAGIAVNVTTGVITVVGSGGDKDAHRVEVLRYTSAGLPDNSLAGGPVTVISSSAGSLVFASGSLGGGGGNGLKANFVSFDASGIAVAPDGTLYIAGSVEATTGAASNFGVAKVAADGTVDTSFGTRGVFATDFAGNGGTDAATSVAVQSNGEIVVAGYTGDPTQSAGLSDYAALRLTSTGTIDDTFGPDGTGKFQYGQHGSVSGGLSEVVNSVVLQGDGKVLLIGTSADPQLLGPKPGITPTNLAVLRLTSAGVLDGTFAAGGLTVSNQGGSTDDGRAGVLQSDGRLLVVGTAIAGASSDISVSRLTTSDTPFVSVFDATGYQNGTIVFNVQLSGSSDTTVTIPYTASDSTALAGVDYKATSGTLSFAPGQTTQSVSVRALVDSQNIASRSLTLNLGSPTGALLSSATATGTIYGTSAGIVPSITLTQLSVTKRLSGSSIATATLQLSNAFTSDISLDYATANGTGASAAVAGIDYASTSGTATIPAGQTTKTIPITIYGDFTRGNTYFSLNLSNGNNVNFGTGDFTDTLPVQVSVIATKFVSKTLTSKSKVTYVDSHKNTFTLTLSGPGTGQLILPLGSNVDADTLVLDKTTAASVVTFTPKKAATVTTLNQVISKKALGTLNLKTVNLNGNLTANGINTLTIRNVAGAALSLGSSKTVVSTVTLGNVSNSSLVTSGSLKALTLGSWVDSDGTPDTVTARSITDITSGGDFDADVTSGSLGTLTAKGVLRGAAIRSDTSVRSVTAAGMINSSILVDTASGTTALPTKSTQFTKHAALQTLGSVTLKPASKKSPAVFTDSLIAAPKIGTLALGTVSTKVSADFGIAAQKSVDLITAALPGKSKFSTKVVSAKNDYVDSRFTNFKIRLTA